MDNFVIITYNTIMNDNEKKSKPSNSDNLETYYFGGLLVKKIEIVEGVFAIAQSPISCVGPITFPPGPIGPIAPIGPFGPFVS